MNTSVTTYIEASVQKYPNKIIFFDTKNSLTFSEVYVFSKALGSFICEKTVPNSPIIVLSGRNVFTPVAYLGVAYAACFYIPLDASLPNERLKKIINLSKAETMIVDTEHLDKVAELGFTGTTVVLENAIHTEINDSALKKAKLNSNENNPLYVIYTSGSTGIPKGVITSNHSLMCYIDAVCKVLKITSNDVLGNQSPLDYIAAIRDIYIPLKTGASTLIIPKEQFAMTKLLIPTLDEYNVTTLCWSVPGVELLAKLKAFKNSVPKHLKTVLFSGSVISSKLLRVWQDYMPNVRYINQYGPTEATASCTYYEIKKPLEDNEIIPIGIPYENYSVILLNEDGKKTKDGEIGEICVSGPILALGYYNDEERTSKSFIQNPLNKNYKELIYKTGDLGRFRKDGILEFHGRNDRQIKHLGHRIELDEVDLFAKTIDSIDDAISLYQNETLYLFYVGQASSKEISIKFREKMPGFMVPRKIICLDKIPTLHNGKKDMQQLQKYILEK